MISLVYCVSTFLRIESEFSSVQTKISICIKAFLSIVCHSNLKLHDKSFYTFSNILQNQLPICLLQDLWKDLQKSNKITKKLCLISKLITLSFITFITLALWQPITAICKFVRDGKYETSEGDTKVQCRKNKRYTDLAASRGELIEVSIEAVFEPMVQGKDFCKILVLIFWILHS